MEFTDYLRNSKRATSSEVRKVAAVFKRAYATAMRVVHMREECGLTQNQLAKLIGIPVSELRRIERGSIPATANGRSRRSPPR